MSSGCSCHHWSKQQSHQLSRKHAVCHEIDSQSFQQETSLSDDRLHDTVQPQIVQEHGNTARVSRPGIKTVTRALRAQPDRCVRRTTRPFAHHLITSTADAGGTASDERADKELVVASSAVQGFFFHDPRLEELMCYTDADWASDKSSRKPTSGGVVTLGGGVLNCWAMKQKSVAL